MDYDYAWNLNIPAELLARFKIFVQNIATHKQNFMILSSTNLVRRGKQVNKH